VWAHFKDFGTDQDKKTYADPRSDHKGETLDLYTVGDAFYDTFTAKTYYDDGNGYSHWRLVRESATFALIGDAVDMSSGRITRFNDIMYRLNASEARDQFGSLNYASGSALEPLGGNTYGYDLHAASSLKTFERVPGARLVGKAAPGARVTAAVAMRANASSREFVWQGSAIAGADGAYAIVVPYSTTAYLDRAHGGTDLDVVAKGPYDVFTGSAQAPTSDARVDVPDEAVLRGTTVAVS
jgi:asparagine N-glycosylation enzyme membrane subunit Stt3